MSSDTADSSVTPPSDQVTGPAKDPIEAALLSKWSPGVPLAKKIANEVAKDQKVSVSQVYKVRKRLSAQRAQAPQTAEQPEDGTLRMEFVATPKPTGDTGTASAATPSVLPAPETTWAAKEIRPMFVTVNEMITAAKRGPPPTDQQTDEIAALWAEALTAFKVPKGEKGGKVLLGAAAVVTTFLVYRPYLRRKEPPQEQAPQEEAPPQ